jgi:hypothetical protein
MPTVDAQPQPEKKRGVWGGVGRSLFVWVLFLSLVFFISPWHAGIFRPNEVSRRNFDGMKTPNPRCFGVWGGLGRKAEVQNPNGVSAKCAIVAEAAGFLDGLCQSAWCLVDKPDLLSIVLPSGTVFIAKKLLPAML